MKVETMVDLKKFKCQHCGECCKDFKSDINHGEENNFISNIQFLINYPNLTLFSWEAKEFQEELKKINSKREVLPSTVLFDLEGKKKVVITYTLDTGECPFLKEEKCSIYENRPLICRIFPLLACSFAEYLLGLADTPSFSRNSLCKADPKVFKQKQNQISAKVLYEIYGDIALYYFGRAFTDRVLAEFIKENKDKLKFAKEGYNIKHLLKRTAKFQEIPLSDYLKEKGIDEELKESLNINRLRKMIK